MAKNQIAYPSIDGVVHIGICGKYIDFNEDQLQELLKTYKEGDKVDIVIIKED